MDKIAILSDIHGNITALESVLNDIKQRKVDKIFCLGDYITKCSHPDLVIDKLRNVADIMLIGNCDEIICKPESKNKNFWSRNLIGEERANFIHSLPISYDFYMSGHLVRLFHASPYSLNELYNPMYSNQSNSYKDLEFNDTERLFDNTEFIKKDKNSPIPDIIGYGHIHTPLLIRYKNKTIFNPGSVGVPVEMHNLNINEVKNKLSTLASYTIIEGQLNSTELSSISFNSVRIPYNVQKEIDDLKKTNMPDKDKVIRSLISAIPNNI